MTYKFRRDGWNRQTRCSQKAVLERAWGFKSPSRHQVAHCNITDVIVQMEGWQSPANCTGLLNQRPERGTQVQILYLPPNLESDAQRRATGFEYRVVGRLTGVRFPSFPPFWIGGRVRLMAHAWKACILKGVTGSNPVLSASLEGAAEWSATRLESVGWVKPRGSIPPPSAISPNLPTFSIIQCQRSSKKRRTGSEPW